MACLFYCLRSATCSSGDAAQVLHARVRLLLRLDLHALAAGTSSSRPGAGLIEALCMPLEGGDDMSGDY